MLFGRPSAGFSYEQLFRAIGEGAERREPPPLGAAHPDFERRAATTAKDGTTIVGPPPYSPTREDARCLPSGPAPTGPARIHTFFTATCDAAPRVAIDRSAVSAERATRGLQHRVHARRLRRRWGRGCDRPQDHRCGRSEERRVGKECRSRAG